MSLENWSRHPEPMRSGRHGLSAAATTDQPSRKRIDTVVEAFMGFCAEHPDAARLILLDVVSIGSDGAKMVAKRSIR